MLDIIILMFLIFGALIGFKRGIIKQSVMTIGIILVIILSFILKNPISSLMYKNLPFFNFYGLYENISVINILLYELISFFLVFAVLSTIFIVLVKISSTIERILRVTIILAIPSKILGAIFGIIEYYLISFIVLFVLMQPVFELNSNKFFEDSKLKNVILEKTPIISNYIQGTLDTIYEIGDLIKDKDKYSDQEVNCKIIEIMKENKIIEQDSLDYLYSSGKIKNKC